MPAASPGIDDESDKSPPVQARTAPRTTAKKISFGAGSKLNIPKELAIDVDEEGDVDERSNDKNPPVNRTTTGAAKATPRTNLSFRAKTMTTANSETSAPSGHKKTSSISSLSSARATKK